MILFGKKIFFPTKPPTSLSFIAKGTKLTGNIEFIGDVLIGGDVSGQILSQANITVEQGGRVEGDIECQEFIVDGFFKGRIICERLVIQRHGVVDGDVTTTSMQIMTGGQFIGLKITEAISTIPTHGLTAAKEPQNLQLTPDPRKADIP